eukprot:2558456-Ditylum_brightwellii.AAC.1
MAAIFRKGVDKATTQATTKTKLLTSYIECKTSALRAHLLRRHQSIHDEIVRLCSNLASFKTIPKIPNMIY